MGGIEDVAVLVAAKFTRLQLGSVPVASAIIADALGGRDGKREQPDQNASAGSAIRLSAPASILRRWAFDSGMIRSA